MAKKKKVKRITSDPYTILYSVPINLKTKETDKKILQSGVVKVDFFFGGCMERLKTVLLSLRKINNMYCTKYIHMYVKVGYPYTEYL